ncbi:CBS domain-containing protein [Tianweitania sediminis]|nr:CBS domain-containing protein [Tianweitania sediminis]
MSGAVLSIGPNATILEAAKLMIDEKISAVPVIDGSVLVGILSEGDLIHRAEIGTAEHRHSWWFRLFQDSGVLAEEYARSHSRHVFDVMTRHVHTVAELTPITDVAEVLDRNRIKRVPVLRDRSVIGIVSRADLMKAIVAAASVEAPLSQEGDDDTICTRLQEELRGQPWASVNGARIEVKSGFVTLKGAISCEDERKATRVLAESVSGVRGIDDQRIIIDHPAMLF